MVVSTITRPGQSAGAGSADALFLRLFAGEVLTEFHQKNIFRGKLMERTLANGKSATFPITGTATAKYHTAGESIYGTDNGQVSNYLSKIQTKEREIFVDDPMLSAVFVPSIDEMKNHWDHQSIYTSELATALADKANYNALATLFAAAKAAPSFNPMTLVDKTITIADASVGANLALFCRKAKVVFDKFNIPEGNRYVAIRPYQYDALAAEKDLHDNRLSGGNNGSLVEAEILRVAGFQIISTNAMPSTDNSAAATGEKNSPFGDGNGYTTSWARCGAVAFTTQAAGTVKMKEISAEAEYSMERQGYTMLAKYVMGHGVLRPECAIWGDAPAGVS